VEGFNRHDRDHRDSNGGVIEMQMLGNVELIRSVPDGLTEKQFDEYRQIADANQLVLVPALSGSVLHEGLHQIEAIATRN
jgi:hypothetical protein